MSLSPDEICELENAIRNLCKLKDECVFYKSSLVDLSQNAIDCINRLLPLENRFKNK